MYVCCGCMGILRKLAQLDMRSCKIGRIPIHDAPRQTLGPNLTWDSLWSLHQNQNRLIMEIGWVSATASFSVNYTWPWSVKIDDKHFLNGSINLKFVSFRSSSLIDLFLPGRIWIFFGCTRYSWLRKLNI